MRMLQEKISALCGDSTGSTTKLLTSTCRQLSICSYRFRSKFFFCPWLCLRHSPLLFLYVIYMGLYFAASNIFLKWFLKWSGCLCLCRSSPRFDPSILPHSGIWGAADEAVLNNVHKKRKKSKKSSFIFLEWTVMSSFSGLFMLCFHWSFQLKYQKYRAANIFASQNAII